MRNQLALVAVLSKFTAATKVDCSNFNFLYASHCPGGTTVVKPDGNAYTAQWNTNCTKFDDRDWYLLGECEQSLDSLRLSACKKMGDYDGTRHYTAHSLVVFEDEAYMSEVATNESPRSKDWHHMYTCRKLDDSTVQGDNGGSLGTWLMSLFTNENSHDCSKATFFKGTGVVSGQQYIAEDGKLYQALTSSPTTPPNREDKKSWQELGICFDSETTRREIAKVCAATPSYVVGTSYSPYTPTKLKNQLYFNIRWTTEAPSNLTTSVWKSLYHCDDKVDASSSTMTRFLQYFGLYGSSSPELMDCSNAQLYSAKSADKDDRMVGPDMHLYQALWPTTTIPSGDRAAWTNVGMCDPASIKQLVTDLCGSVPAFKAGVKSPLVLYNNNVWHSEVNTNDVPGKSIAWKLLYPCKIPTTTALKLTAQEVLDCSDIPLYLGQACSAGTKVVNQASAVFKSNWISGVPPTASDDGWTYVGVCSEVIDAELRQTCEEIGEYDSKRIYTAGDKATYGGYLYYSKWWTQSPPGMDTSWVAILDCHFISPSPAPTPPPTAPSTTTTTRATGTKKSTTTTTRKATTPTTTRPRTTTTTPRTTTTTPRTTTTTRTTTTRTTTTTPRRTTTTTTPRRTTTTTRRTTTTSTTARPYKPTVEPGPVRPDGPVGPNGECVWPEWDSSQAYKDGYVSYLNNVYHPAYYANPGQPPTSGTPWQSVRGCTGKAPGKLTEAEILAQVDPNAEGIQMVLDPWNPLFPTPSEIAAIEDDARADPVIQLVAEAARLLDPEEVELIEPGRAENPENVQRVENIFPEENWYKWFPLAASTYTYTNLLRAVGLTPLFCQTYTDGRDSDMLCMKSLATSFAHFVQETSANWPNFSWPANSQPDHYHAEAADYYSNGQKIPLQYQALWYVREAGYTEDRGGTEPYRSCGLQGSDLFWALNYPCYDHAGYFGRGAKQLSWNYNYGRFSDAIYGDATILNKDPAKVADTWLNLASATWFFVTPQSPKPSMQQVIDGTWQPNAADTANGLTPSFGTTIQIINGGLECGKGGNAAAQNRGAAYKAWMTEFGLTVDPSEDVDCQKSQNFDSGSSAAYTQYWVRDWSGAAACKTGSEQTPWIVAKDGDYQRCVDFFFRSHHVLNGKVIADYGDPH